MSNARLRELIVQFIKEQNSTQKDESYCTAQQEAYEVMGWFVEFLNANGVAV